MTLRGMIFIPFLLAAFAVTPVNAAANAGTDYDIGAVCAAKWRGAHKMRAHCEEKHYEGYGIYRGFQYRYGLHRLTETEFDAAVAGRYLPAEILHTCGKRWLSRSHKNYEMMAYCVAQKESKERRRLGGISTMLLQLRQILADAGLVKYQ